MIDTQQLEWDRELSRDRMERSIDRCFGVAAFFITVYVLSFMHAGFLLPTVGQYATMLAAVVFVLSALYILFITFACTVPEFIRWLKGY